MDTTAPRELSSIQYLRGCAAIAVLLSHAFSHPLAEPTRDMLVTGRLGVILFFVISGFIMVFVTGRSRFDAKIFLRKRILRIVPFYWTVTLFVAAAAIVVPMAFKTTVVSLSHLVTSLLFVPAPNPASAQAILPLVKLGWTLNYEMFFYVLFACCAFCKVGWRVAIVSLTIVFLAVVGMVTMRTSAVLLFYTAFILTGFVGGMLVGLLYISNGFARLGRWCVVMAALVATLTIGASYMIERRHPDYYSTTLQSLLIVGSAAILVMAIWIESRGKLPRWRLLRFLGDASYSIYLVHLLGIGAAFVVWRRLQVAETGWLYGLTVLFGFVAGLMAGCAAYVFVERPLTRWARRMSDRYVKDRRSEASEKASLSQLQV